MYSLTQLIGWSAIQKMLNTPTGGVKSIAPFDRILSQTTPIMGLTAEWVRVANSRQVAPFNDHGASSRAMDEEAVENVSIKCMHVLNHIVHKSEIISALHNFDNPQMQKMAADLIEYQTGEFKRKHDNQKIAALTSFMLLNAVYLDGNGNLLPSSSGAKRTVNFGATYTGSGAILYNTALESSETIGDWATGSTDISKGIASLKKWYGKVNGRQLKYAVYGTNVPGYMRLNDQWEFYTNSPTISEKFSQNIIPEGFWAEGITWIPGNELGFQDASGTYQWSLDGDQILWLPEIDRSWIEVQNGTEALPQGAGDFSDAPAAISGGFRQATGAYTMCTVNREPPAALKQFMGDNYMIALKEATAPVLTDIKNG